MISISPSKELFIHPYHSGVLLKMYMFQPYSYVHCMSYVSINLCILLWCFNILWAKCIRTYMIREIRIMMLPGDHQEILELHVRTLIAFYRKKSISWVYVVVFAIFRHRFQLGQVRNFTSWPETIHFKFYYLFQNVYPQILHKLLSNYKKRQCVTNKYSAWI